MTEPLWTSKELAAAVGIKSKFAWSGYGVSIDTRTLKKGDIFIAISDKRDGHDFVEQAFKLGAVAALVSRIPTNLDKEKPCLVVKDVMKALFSMASYSVSRSRAKVIAITGSVGKTSSKDMMALALSCFGTVHKAEKSFNNHIGLPLTLARAPSDVDYIVLEIGMSNKGEILPLSLLASPHAALITNVSAAHLSAFKNINEIAKEKSDLCSGLRSPRICVVSRDSECYPALLRYVKKNSDSVISFGEKGFPQFQLIKTVSKNNITCAQASKRGGGKFFYKVKSLGKHNALNVLGVIAVLDAFKLDITKAILALSDWVPSKGRGSLIKVKYNINRVNGSFTIVDETYNANPKSMEAAIDVLSKFECPLDVESGNKQNRRIAILGDMLELGTDEKTRHEKLLETITLGNIDLVHCIGKRMKFLYKKLPQGIKGKWYETVSEIIPTLQSLIRVNDVIMIKASNSVNFYRLVEELKALGEKPTN